MLLCLVGAGTAIAQSKPGDTATSSCVDVRVGSAEAYNCLNRNLQNLVPQQRTVGADMGINAMSPAPQTGTYNQAAVREHLGDNFGKSAVPQRPPPPVYPSPLRPGR